MKIRANFVLLLAGVFVFLCCSGALADKPGTDKNNDKPKTEIMPGEQADKTINSIVIKARLKETKIKLLKSVPSSKNQVIETDKANLKKNKNSSQEIEYDYDEKGYLSVGFMHWYGPSFFLEASHPFIVCKVTKISNTRPDGYYRIEMQVLEIIGKKKREELDKLKGIAIVNAYKTINDIKLGDQLVTSTMIYENADAIPHYTGTNCVLGYKIILNENGKLSDISKDFLEMLRRTASNKRTAEDYRIWAEIDPSGVAEMHKRMREITVDWPHPNPKEPPVNEALKNYDAEKIMPFVMGDLQVKDLMAPDSCRLACAWFIWKTRDDAKLRNDLADKIVSRLHKIAKQKDKMLHDYSYLASFLGPLGARKQTIKLLKEQKDFDCCYGPALVRSLGMCGTKGDIPFLIDNIDKEREGCAGILNEVLQKLTNKKMPTIKNGYTDKKSWQEWWDKNKARILETEKFLSLLKDEKKMFAPVVLPALTKEAAQGREKELL